MTRNAWYCPGCQKHHAPHIDTCPGGNTEGIKIGIIQVSRPKYQHRDCNCPLGAACGSSACPRALRTIFASHVTAGWNC
jgi:hypothetical protein